MILWIKNTDGKEDAVLTMAFVAFMVIILKVIFGGVEFSTGENFSMNFGVVDAGVIAALLTPTLGAYVARRHTDVVRSKRRKTETDETEE